MSLRESPRVVICDQGAVVREDARSAPRQAPGSRRRGAMGIKERRSYVLCSAVHESGLRELVSQLVIGVLLTHNVHGAKQR